ncbi:hypothetical protein E3U43_021021 [Larimichthys crocea]|uniref:Uncharacterized protein n=1 Tax=Larimichthys crocea TaxID=215358 RepID=A0ACD3Q782_LARCR|nr:hypothetical protein E3U43_021021 [Larimichthys crocea]
MGAIPQHLPEEVTDKEEANDFTEKISSTIAPETVPTALTWAAARTTTTIPGLVETTFTITPPTSSETMFVRKDSTVSITLHAEEATMMETHPTHSGADLGFSEARSGSVDEQLGVFTTAMGIDHKLVPESITTTTQSQRVNTPIAGGKGDKADEETEEDVAHSADGDGYILADISTPVR